MRNFSISGIFGFILRFAVEGNLSVFLTLALCLTVSFGGVGFIALGSVFVIVASRFRIIGEALRLYGSHWVRSDAFALNLLVLIVTLIEFGLLLYHRDGSSEMENQLKQYGATLAVLLTVQRYSLGTLIWGAAAGSFLAGIVAANDFFIEGLVRAAGPTNPIRFGMTAALLSVYCLMGALFLRAGPRGRLVIGFCGLVGLFAVFASGSRGAVLALPVMLLLLVPHLWHRSRQAAVMGMAVVLAASVAFGLWQANLVRIEKTGLGEATASMLAGKHIDEESTRNRVELLRLSAHAFLKHPLLGIGGAGWDEEVRDEMRNGTSEAKLEEAFNQPHNQYANDFVKGGLVRGLSGLAMLVLPFYCFLIRHPFRPARSALAPLLGVTTCAAFATFGLTESVMDLSLPSSIYVVLIFYLMGITEGAPLDTFRRPAAERQQAEARLAA